MQTFGTGMCYALRIICSPCVRYAFQKFSCTPQTVPKKLHLFIVVFFIVFAALPGTAAADVIFSEIAWMGTSVDANNEWIEIYNNSSEAIDLTGWTISDGNSLLINLEGVMQPHGMFLLERTDDTTVPGVTATLLYTGALTNGGATLTIKDATGAVVGTPLVGGEDWVHIGGDNDLKYSAQITSTGQWVTGPQTPGMQNVTDDELPEDIVPDDEIIEETEEIDEDTDDESTALSAAIPLRRTLRELYSSIALPDRVYVNQEVLMEVRPSGLADGILRSLTHTWNFGDFTTGAGKETVHRYAYPGEYVVTLHSQYREYESYTRKTIMVLPVSFSMTTNASGDVQVHNDARYEVDLSGYTVVAGESVTFPQRTILLPNATITIPKETVQYARSGTATLFDDTTVLVASVFPVESPEAPAAAFVRTVQSPMLVPLVPVTTSAPQVSSTNFSFADEVAEESKNFVATHTTAVYKGTSQMAAPIEAEGTIPDGKLPYFALLAVIGLGVTAVFAGKINK